MTLALGLAALLLGADLVIAGATKRPLSRLAFGYWDAPGTSTTATAPGTKTKGGGNAMTGGVYTPGPGAVYTGPGQVTVHGI